MSHQSSQHESHPHAQHDHGIGHVVSPKILVATGGALLVLTAVTVLAAKVNFEDFDLREMNIIVALGIAVLKASLVCLFFMHLRWDRPFNAFVLVSSLALVALFIGFAMTDSGEYQHEVIQGDSAVIQSKLDELPKAAPPAAVEH